MGTGLRGLLAAGVVAGLLIGGGSDVQGKGHHHHHHRDKVSAATIGKVLTVDDPATGIHCDAYLERPENNQLPGGGSGGVSSLVTFWCTAPEGSTNVVSAETILMQKGEGGVRNAAFAFVPPPDGQQAIVETTKTEGPRCSGDDQFATRARILIDQNIVGDMQRDWNDCGTIK